MKKALVTGGLGFLGSHLISELVARKVDVSVLDDCSTGKVGNIGLVWDKVAVTFSSVQSPNVFDRLLDVDVIFHLAATNLVSSVKSPQHDLAVNLVGTLNLLSAMREKKSKAVLVFASSGSVYGEPLYNPQSEDHPLNPTSPYGISKLAAEKYIGYFVREYGLKTVILRYYNIIGPRQNYSESGGVVPIFVRRMLQGLPLIIEGDGCQERVFTDVRDVVNATLRCAECKDAYGRVFNIATEEITTINELAKMVSELSAVPLEIQHVERRVGDIQSFSPSVALAKCVLGFQPEYRLKDSLESVVEWMRCELGL